MVMPEFNIRLCGPTIPVRKSRCHTIWRKKHYYPLNNNGYYRSEFFGSVNRMKRMSTYLWVGLWPIRIESVRNIKIVINYASFFTALFLFDCMLSGTTMNLRGGINRYNDDK